MKVMLANISTRDLHLLGIISNELLAISTDRLFVSSSSVTCSNVDSFCKNIETK